MQINCTFYYCHEKHPTLLVCSKITYFRNFTLLQPNHAGENQQIHIFESPNGVLQQRRLFIFIPKYRNYFDTDKTKLLAAKNPSIFKKTNMMMMTINRLARRTIAPQARRAMSTYYLASHEYIKVKCILHYIRSRY